jgi:hypothetical protein
MALRIAAPLVAVSLAAMIGRAADCSSSAASGATPDDSGVPDGALVGCATDPRDDTYAADLTKAGTQGNFKFVLVSATPGPPGLDVNSWVVQLVDGSGAPVTGATFATIKPWMPDHGHGSTATPQVTDNQDGTYTIANLYFFMAGLWQVPLAVQVNGKNDTATFSFCVAG